MLSELFLSRVSLRREVPEGNYLAKLPVVRALQRRPLEFKKPLTLFVGENGVGKSTLIEAIAVAMGFNPEGGTVNFRFKTEDSHSELCRLISVGRGVRHPDTGFFLRAESFYNVATAIDRMDKEPSFGPPLINSYGGVSLHRQSHGESFMALVTHRFGKNGLYILDEPEAALSPMRQLELLARLHELAENGSQLVVSTHSPLLMALPGADVIVLTETGMQRVEYRETEHFQVMQNFMANPERMLRYLL